MVPVNPGRVSSNTAIKWFRQFRGVLQCLESAAVPRLGSLTIHCVCAIDSLNARLILSLEEKKRKHFEKNEK